MQLDKFKKGIAITGLVVLLTIGLLLTKTNQEEASLGATPALTAFQGGTGTSSPSGILYGDKTIRLKTVEIGTGLSFSGGTLSATGGAGGGTGTVSTSTNESSGFLSYWTSNSATPALLGKVATTSLTASSPLSLSQAISVIGGSASALSLDTSGTWSGNAGTASALFANGANCSSGSAPLGVSALGASENCFDVWTEAENTSAGYVASIRALTVAGTANQVTSSAGSQNLSADRTWTLSLPNHVIFPSSFRAISATTTNATSTNQDITGLLTFGGVTGSAWTNFCVSITGGSGLCDGTDAVGGGGSSLWATSTDNTSIYPSSGATTPVIIGATATTSLSSILNVTGQSYFTGNVGIGTSSPYAKLSVVGEVVGNYFTATSTTATSTLPLLTVDAISVAGDYVEDITGTGLSVTDGVLSASTNAETLDLIDSASFLRSDASDSYTSGTLTFDASTSIDINSTTLSIADTSIVFDGSATNFAVTGDFSINTNDLFIESSDGDFIINGIATTSASFAVDVSQNLVLLGSTGSGDKAIGFYNPSGIAAYILGLDDSDSDAFVLAASGSLGTSNLWRVTSASSTVLNPLEIEADTTYFYPASNFEIEGVSRVCTSITNLPGNGILTLTPTAVPSSCTIQFSVPVPQILHGENSRISTVDFYYATASTTARVDVNQVVEYNPIDGTVTTHDNDTADITSGTSHSASGLPVYLGSSEDGSSLLLRYTISFTTTVGAGNAFVMRGAKIVWDTD